MSFPTTQKVFFSLSLALFFFACGASEMSDEGYQISSSLTAPSQLEATAGNKIVTLQWNESPMAESYLLYYGTSQELGEVEAVNGQDFTVLGLTNDVTYYFAVASVNAKGEISRRSKTISATPSLRQEMNEPITQE